MFMDNGDHIERIALEMIERFGDGATYVALVLADVSDEVQDDMLRSAETWRDIAEATEQFLTNATRAI